MPDIINFILICGRAIFAMYLRSTVKVLRNELDARKQLEDQSNKMSELLYRRSTDKRDLQDAEDYK